MENVQQMENIQQMGHPADGKYPADGKHPADEKPWSSLLKAYVSNLTGVLLSWTVDSLRTLS